MRRRERRSALSPQIALCDQRQRKNVASCPDIFYRLGVGRKRDERLKTAVASPTVPNMMDLPLIPILGPFGGNQLIAALNALGAEA